MNNDFFVAKIWILRVAAFWALVSYKQILIRQISPLFPNLDMTYI